MSRLLCAALLVIPACTLPSADAAKSCGRAPGAPEQAVKWPHGHGAANKRCDNLETLWANVLHSELTCKTNDDCARIASDGNCLVDVLNKKAAASDKYKEPRCGNPASGACGEISRAAACVSGCCVLRDGK